MKEFCLVLLQDASHVLRNSTLINVQPLLLQSTHGCESDFWKERTFPAFRQGQGMEGRVSSSRLVHFADAETITPPYGHQR